MFKVLTVVSLLFFSVSSLAGSNKNNPTFKQLKQDMLVHGLDFNYITSTKKSPIGQFDNIGENQMTPKPGVFPEEISEVLKIL